MKNVASPVPQSGDKITTASHASMIYTVTVANSGNKYSWCVPDMYIYGGVQICICNELRGIMVRSTRNPKCNHTVDYYLLNY